ncbi:MAG: hypothetical protein AB7S77_02040 [Desulfatirhabdiaceae bacterium]
MLWTYSISEDKIAVKDHMIHSHLTFFASRLIWLFSVLIVFAACLCFRSSGRTIAESGASALIITCIAISIWIHAAIVPGWDWTAMFVPVAAAGLAVALIWRLRYVAIQIWRSAVQFARSYPFPVAMAVAAIGFRIIWAMSGPAPGFPVSPSAEIIQLSPDTAASLFDSQSLLWMRICHSMAGKMAYGAIGLSTFALSRRHAWAPASLTATLVVLGMPRLANPHGIDSELITAAAALFVLMTLYRIIEDPRIDDLILLIPGLVCTWSTHPMGWILPSLLTFLTLLLIGRRHGLVHMTHLVRHHRWRVVSAGGLAVMMLPLWSRSVNFWGQNPHSIIRYNTDGLSGAAANLMRYVLQVAHLGPSARSWVRPISHWWQGILEGIYQSIAPLLSGNSGAISPFNLSTGIGFGPISLLLVLPAVGYSLVRGPRRLRAIAISIGWYWFLLVLVPVWQPDNIQLLTPLMAISGFMVAFFLPPWRFSRIGQFLLNLLCLLSLCYSFIQ